MATENITIEVASDSARVLRALPSEQRRKLEVLLSLRLIEFSQAADSLENVMRDIGRQA